MIRDIDRTIAAMEAALGRGELVERTEPTPTDRANMAALTAHADELEAVRQADGWQAMLDAANRLIDASAGIVAGDGCYYPRWPEL